MEKVPKPTFMEKYNVFEPVGPHVAATWFTYAPVEP